LKQKIQEMQEQHKNNVKELEEKSKKALKDHKVDLAIVAAGPTDATATKAIKALLNSEAISLDGDNLIGISEQIEKLKKESAYLFAGTASGNTDPANPKKPDDDGSTDDALTDDQLFEKRMADRNKG
jgi:coenzyme F420-reducing hydrogenase gamma subunit